MIRALANRRGFANRAGLRFPLGFDGQRDENNIKHPGRKEEAALG